MTFIPMQSYSRFLIVILVLLIPDFSNAQFENNYYPRKNHSKASEALINELISRFDEENRNMEGNREVRQINFERKKLFLGKVFEGAFIKDDSLENYVNRVLNKIESHNTLGIYPRHVLILASPHVNAVCYGQGIYAVTISLLGRLSNENQLAFILSHEIAHDELGHIKTRIFQEADLNLDVKAKEQTIKIISGKIIQEDIDEFRKLIYDISRYSRKNEIRADSMAFVLLSNAHYNKRESFTALSALQSAQSPKQEIGAELFLPFHSDKYPFQDYWLNDRLTVYSKKYQGNFLFSADSIESHPGIELRKESLSSYLADERVSKNNQPVEFVNAVTEIAEFETVESAYKNNEYDLCIYYALQLLNKYPRNAYLISRIGKVLVDLCEARNSNRFELYVSKYTANYSDELKLINSFLYNLTTKELSEVAFHFLNYGSNFNDGEKSHYYLLWKISDLTYRNDIKDKMKNSFRKKFDSNINSYSYE